VFLLLLKIRNLAILGKPNPHPYRKKRMNDFLFQNLRDLTPPFSAWPDSPFQKNLLMIFYSKNYDNSPPGPPWPDHPAKKKLINSILFKKLTELPLVLQDPIHLPPPPPPPPQKKKKKPTPTPTQTPNQHIFTPRKKKI